MFLTKQKSSILHEWTKVYVSTLVIGLALIFLLTIAWMRYSDTKQHLQMMELTLELTAEQLINTGEHPSQRPLQINNNENMRPINPTIFILNQAGDVLSFNRQSPFLAYIPQWFKEKKQTQLLDEARFYVVQKPLQVEEEVKGYILAVEPVKPIWSLIVDAKYVFVLLALLGILGWLAIYMVTKRLSKPILEVANAAKQVEEGNYHIHFAEHYRELEMDMLLSSFKEMVSKLEQLEKTRTELLAGVTHELKTPVTSVSGLLQAVNDGVVDEQQAKVFLQMAYEEIQKMKRMVDDLLTFNMYAVDAIPVEMKEGDIGRLVRQTVEKFKQTMGITYSLHIDVPCLASYDEVRLQQVLENILTNAVQATQNDCHITITATQQEGEIILFVSDNGSGIPEDEQAFIFERFYRGDAKKYSVRGLGLGLALSKMMMQSMRGDLRLVTSSVEGTTFSIVCQRA